MATPYNGTASHAGIPMKRMTIALVLLIASVATIYQRTVACGMVVVALSAQAATVIPSALSMETRIIIITTKMQETGNRDTQMMIITVDIMLMTLKMTGIILMGMVMVKETGKIILKTTPQTMVRMIMSVK